MKNYLKNRVYLLVTVIFAVFSAVIAGTNILGGDDILWTLDESRHDVFGSTSVNGRYLTNAVTFVAVRVWILRFLIAFVFVFLLHQLMLRVISADREVPGWAAAFSAVALLTIRPEMFTQTINWISGITNYVISAVILMSVLLYFKPLLCGEKLGRKKYTAILIFLLGFAGSLCVENVTIYSICLGVFLMVYSWKCHKELHIGIFAYIVGAAAGAAVMFTNHTYSTLFGSNTDEVGFRRVSVDFSDIFHQVYEDVIAYYCVPFWILHIVIYVSLMFLYSGKFGNGRATPPKYTKAALTVTALYTAYSFFTNIYGGFAVWNAALTIRGIEAAFTFMYILSLFFLGSVLCSRQSFTRFALYLCSTVILSAPFAAANPVTERCFFTDLIFWILAAGELSSSVVSTYSFERCYPVRFLSVVSAGYLAFSIAYMCAWNKYTDVMRFNYIKQQLDDGRKSLEFIKLPYPSYVPRDELDAYKDAIEQSKREDNFGTDQALSDTGMRIGYELFKAHGITERVYDLNIIMISLYDYDLK